MATNPSSITAYRAEQARDMLEEVLLANVLMAARRCGWLCYHTHSSRRSAPGFPDCICLRKADRIGHPSEILVIELKTERGQTTADQDAWLDHFRAAGIEAVVWRPADWLNGTITARLARKGG